MKLILLTIGLLALGIAGIAIKIWAKKMVNFQELVRVKIHFLIKAVSLAGFVVKHLISLKIVQNQLITKIK